MGEPYTKTLYFGYGSNLWLDQMAARCPGSRFIGIGSLSDWKWIINGRGYANIISSEGDIVYGMIYELTEDDEKKLDRYEGVPNSYTKHMIPITLTRDLALGGGEPGKTETVDALFYIDFKRVTESKPRREYVDRINKGIADGERKGITKEYFDKYFRPFIPELP